MHPKHDPRAGNQISNRFSLNNSPVYLVLHIRSFNITPRQIGPIPWNHKVEKVPVILPQRIYTFIKCINQLNRHAFSYRLVNPQRSSSNNTIARNKSCKTLLFTKIFRENHSDIERDFSKPKPLIPFAICFCRVFIRICKGQNALFTMLLPGKAHERPEHTFSLIGRMNHNIQHVKGWIDRLAQLHSMQSKRTKPDNFTSITCYPYSHWMQMTSEAPAKLF